MATQPEKTGTIGSLLDDIATLLDGTAAWTDADASVTNSQTDNKWYNNGRVYQNSNTGTYLFMYVAPARAERDNHRAYYSNNYNYINGIRFVVSSDWDSDKHVPDGFTSVRSGDGTLQNWVEHQRSSSYQYHEEEYSYGGAGLWTHRNWGPSDRTTFVNEECTYYASAGDDYLTAAAWNNSNSNYGAASFISFEHVDGKFYDDGTTPYCLTQRSTASYRNDNNQNEGTTHYGFNDFEGDSQQPIGMVGGDGAVEQGEWGRLNPDANDDTFFVKRPTIYRSKNKRVPVAYVEAALPNDVEEGVSHGDTITYDGVDYRAIRQSGASRTYPVVACLKYQ